jgi:hypothetical protein
MALTEKIKCNGIKPSKAEMYTLAAELLETEQILNFRSAIIEAFKSYDYYDPNYYYYDNYDYDYEYDYDYYYYYDYDYDYCYYNNYSIEEKVITLLFFAAMYS